MSRYEDSFSANYSSFSLWDLIKVSLGRKAVIILCATVGIALGFAALKLVSPQATARLLIKPLASEDSPTPNKELTIGGGLLGNNTDQSIALYIGTLHSSEMLSRAIKDRGLAQLLFSDRWDAANNRWLEPTGFLADVKRSLNEFLGRPKAPPMDDPSVVSGAVDEMLTAMSFDKLTPTIFEITVTDKSGDRALEILTILHQETISLIRENKIRNAQTLLNSMRARYQEVSELVYRTALTEQIVTQEKRLMMLQDKNYPIIDVVDPPSISSPARGLPIALTVLAGMLVGTFFGMLINIGAFFQRQPR